MIMRRRIRKLELLMLALVVPHTLALAQSTNPPAPVTPTNSQQRLHAWWRDGAPGQRPYTAKAKQMPLISVKGNKFVDPNGNTVLFRGLSISDPDKLEMQGHWTKDHFLKVKELGTKLVRIPIHPVAWRERTPAQYLKLLDQAVGWCTELEHHSGLALHWQPRDRPLPGLHVRDDKAGDLQFLASNGPAFRRPQHRGLL